MHARYSALLELLARSLIEPRPLAPAAVFHLMASSNYVPPQVAR